MSRDVCIELWANCIVASLTHTRTCTYTFFFVAQNVTYVHIYIVYVMINSLVFCLWIQKTSRLIFHSQNFQRVNKCFLAWYNRLLFVSRRPLAVPVTLHAADPISRGLMRTKPCHWPQSSPANLWPQRDVTTSTSGLNSFYLPQPEVKATSCNHANRSLQSWISLHL